MAQATLEFWFEFASNYTYLSMMRIEDAAKRAGVTLVWKPFLLGPILHELGMTDSPFITQKEKGAYVWQDMIRQCRKYGLRWKQPTSFPRPGVLPARIACLGAAEPWIGPFSRAVMERNFADDGGINRPEDIHPILRKLGLPADTILQQAQSEPVKAALRAQTGQARAHGLFGAPMFLVGRDMFWGNDRLDDALALAAGDLTQSAT